MLPNSEMNFRHSATQHLRSRIEKALREVESVESRLLRWERCGCYATVMKTVSTPVRYMVRSMRCKNRFCPACAIERSRTIANAIVQKIGGEPHRFLTLTLKHSTKPLAIQIRRLIDSFKKLRKTPLWRHCVTAGITILEIKRTKGWHPHLHVIITGQYMAHAEIRAEWFKITGDSSIVDIRLVRNARQTGLYVAKYASKPLDRSVTHNHEALKEAILALAGVRMVFTIGKWRGWRITEKNDDEVWITVDKLDNLIRDARRGMREAIEVLNELRKNRPCQLNEDEQNENQVRGPPR